jgi:polyvinyl alcohol dehydrogenase (cytochrome)
MALFGSAYGWTARAGSVAGVLLASACSGAPAADSTAPGVTGTQPTAATQPSAPATVGATTPSGPAAGAPAATTGTSAAAGTPAATPPATPQTPPAMAATAGAGAQPPNGTTPGQPQTPGETAGGEPSAVDWTMMGYDPGSTYFNTAETTLTKQNAAQLKEIWTADLGGPVYSAPLQVGDTIYAAGPASVRAYEAASGKELWQTAVTSTSTLGYLGGTLYVDTPSSEIVALDAESGMKLWNKKHHMATEADGNSSPIPVGDVVYIGGSNGNMELAGGGTFRGYLSALNRMTGDILWHTYTVPEGARGASIWSTPSVDVEGGFVYGSTGNNYGAPATDTSDAILQFDIKTGAMGWKAQRVMGDTFGAGVGPDADFGANPVLYETMVGGQLTKVASAGNKGGDAHAVRRDNGMVLWTRNLGGGSATGSAGVFTNSTWTGKNMLFAQNNNGPATLYALDGATGDIVWEARLPGQVWGRLAVANGIGFVGTGSNLLVFDVDTGETITMFPTQGGTLASGITVSRGRVAFGEGLSWSGGAYGSTLHVLSVQ